MAASINFRGRLAEFEANSEAKNKFYTEDTTQRIFLKRAAPLLGGGHQLLNSKTVGLTQVKAETGAVVLPAGRTQSHSPVCTSACAALCSAIAEKSATQSHSQSASARSDFVSEPQYVLSHHRADTTSLQTRKYVKHLWSCVCS